MQGAYGSAAGSSLGVVGGGSNPTPREQTINERLNESSNDLIAVCYRLESVLSRVNGAPEGNANAVTPKPPMLPLAAVMETIGKHVARLQDLASGIERIA